MRVHHRFITSPLHLRLGLDERARESQMSLQLARFALNRRGGGGGWGLGQGAVERNFAAQRDATPCIAPLVRYIHGFLSSRGRG